MKFTRWHEMITRWLVDRTKLWVTATKLCCLYQSLNFWIRQRPYLNVWYSKVLMALPWKTKLPIWCWGTIKLLALFKNLTKVQWRKIRIFIHNDLKFQSTVRRYLAQKRAEKERTAKESFSIKVYSNTKQIIRIMNGWVVSKWCHHRP